MQNTHKENNYLADNNLMTSTTSVSAPEAKICLARQPILNVNESIIGYEILFRQINATESNVIDGITATADVIVNLLNNIGLNNVIGNKKAFINFGQYLLQNDIIKVLPKDRVVIEILEDVSVDENLYTQLESLVNAGYILAIDDFIDNDSTQKLFKLVDIMKIDITDYTKEQLVTYSKLGKQHNLTLLAERVETREEFVFCKALGFDLFQGYFFAKPEYIEKQSIPSNKMSIMSILSSILSNKPVEEIEKQITRDVSLNYKLLQYINSAGLRRATDVNNIHDAIRLIGIKPLYRWLSLFLFSNDDDNKNASVTSLFSTALMRGFFLEYIANKTNPKIANDIFVLGIFSYLDTLLKIPMPEVLQQIDIHESIKDALLHQTGPYHDYYQLALVNDVNKVPSTVGVLELNAALINDANLFAMQSANNLL